jgi:quaternary ammonium compound-resistance protein SugE
MAWMLLLLAGAFEVGFTTSMQFMKNARSWWPIVSFVICVALSMLLLGKAAQQIPVGTAYAVWTGIGAFGTALLGLLYFGEPATPMRLLFLATLIGSVIGLKLVS